LEKRPILKIESIMEALKKALPPRRHNLIPLNQLALTRGKELVKLEENVLGIVYNDKQV
jgi:2-oxoglutarate ferredoxin oxidoreductase subunit gamma